MYIAMNTKKTQPKLKLACCCLGWPFCWRLPPPPPMWNEKLNEMTCTFDSDFG
jgi:hypothetical protein